MYEVIFTLSDGTASEITSDWQRVVDENRPYLEQGDKVKVYDREGNRIHYEKV